MLKRIHFIALISGLLVTACSTGSMTKSQQAAHSPLHTKNMDALKGQAATCSSSKDKTFNLDVIETTVDLGMGTTFAAWTYNGRLPAPTIEACEGDRVTITVNNKGTTSHGLDTHAFRIDTRKFGPVEPGKSMVMTAVTDNPGVFMYHCASGPVTDFHIKSGLHGAMIVYPRNEPLRPAREITVVEDAVFGTRDEKGFIPGTDPSKSQKNDEIFSMFDGRLDNDAIPVNRGDLIRIYFVNVGPGTSSAHVMGTSFDRVYDGKTYLSDVQSYGVSAGNGAILEFYMPQQSSVNAFVDHDKLAYLPYGLMLGFTSDAGMEP